MPYGARTSLVALILALGLGGASAEPAPGTTWTDPPAHKPAAEKAPAADQKAAPGPAVPPPAAAMTRPKPAARKAVATRRTPERSAARRSPAVAKRFALAPRRARFAAAPARPVRSSPQIVADAPSPVAPVEGYGRYRAYGYGPGSGYAQGYADDRLDRLSSAQAAGYLVMRRRTVQFPDGRMLRVYRPEDEGEPF